MIRRSAAEISQPTEEGLRSIFNWESLGIFTVASGTITVTIIDDHDYSKHNNFVADQILIEKVKSPVPQTEYEWDYHNRLTKVTVTDDNSSVETVDYLYDVFGRRIGKDLHYNDATVGSFTAKERYVYDSDQVILDLGDDSSGGFHVKNRYLNGPAVDQLFAVEEVEFTTGASDHVLWTLSDHQNSVRELYGKDAAGHDVLKHIDYDVFGRPDVFYDNPEAIASDPNNG